MNIRPLFPTPIACIPNFITSKERLQLIKSINNISHHSHDSIDGDGLSTHKQRPSFLDRAIKKRIQNAVDEYNKEYGARPCKISNMWSNIQNKGSRLTEHTHASSIISGGKLAPSGP